MYHQPYKHYRAGAIDAATRIGCTDFNKLEFLSAITAIRNKAFKYTTISAFWQTGLIPFNPATKRREILKAAQKKPRKELRREVRMKAKAWSKALKAN